MSEDIESVSFDLVNEDAVKRLKKDGKIKVPEKKISVPKDMRWNEKQMASKILQGIQNGDSIDKISESLKDVIGNNQASSIRNARTMTTSAENQGRLDSYKKLEEKGVVIKKVWVATPDDRVRESHLNMDGEEVDIDEKFSNGLMKPADGNGPAEEVWNCRCSMHSRTVGFKKKDGTISYIKGSPDKTMHAEQIEKQKEKRQAKPATAAKANIVNGKDISSTWTRRADKFKFEIEDVINAQGFDGLPQVVSPDEFERYVEEANDGKGFVAQRTYSAPNQATLDEYRDQLYNGKWYVDCSTGGSQYGQGMYCAADYNGKLNQGITAEMEHYKNLNISKCLDSISEADKNRILELRDELEKIDVDKYGDPYKVFVAKNSDIIKERLNIDVPVAYTETLTLDKSAKVITYDDLQSIKHSSEKYIERNIANIGLTDEELSVINRELSLGDIEQHKKARQLERENPQKYDEIINKHLSTAEKVYDDSMAKYDELRNLDDGSFAALMGYDAINAEGHGESGSYTVILNRTKLIIKGGK